MQSFRRLKERDTEREREGWGWGLRRELPCPHRELFVPLGLGVQVRAPTVSEKCKQQFYNKVGWGALTDHHVLLHLMSQVEA